MGNSSCDVDVADVICAKQLQWWSVISVIREVYSVLLEHACRVLWDWYMFDFGDILHTLR